MSDAAQDSSSFSLPVFPALGSCRLLSDVLGAEATSTVGRTKCAATAIALINFTRYRSRHVPGVLRRLSLLPLLRRLRPTRDDRRASGQAGRLNEKGLRVTRRRCVA